jgi:hypothetical protein
MIKKMETGEAAIRLTRAAINTGEYPDDVPDTPANRDMFAKIKAECEAMPDNVTPDVPNDYNMTTTPVRK